jgi:hypothetical protein
MALPAAVVGGCDLPDSMGGLPAESCDDARSAANFEGPAPPARARRRSEDVAAVGTGVSAAAAAPDTGTTADVLNT